VSFPMFGRSLIYHLQQTLTVSVHFFQLPCDRSKTRRRLGGVAGVVAAAAAAWVVAAAASAAAAATAAAVRGRRAVILHRHCLSLQEFSR
jgi:hypothetical protein